MDIKIYGATWCGFCVKSKELCESNGLQYKWVDIDADPTSKAYIKEELGATTIPQILIDGELVGGYNEFRKLINS